MGRSYFTLVSRMDVDRFRAEVSDRFRPADDRIEHPKLPLHPRAEAAIEAAIAIATERRRDTVQGHHLLYALLRGERGAAADLLARHGSSPAALNAELEKVL